MAKMFLIPFEITHEEPREEEIDGEKITFVPNDPKCSCCNWNVQNLYRMADTLEKAIEEFHEADDAGFCGGCMCDLLTEPRYDITVNDGGVL